MHGKFPTILDNIIEISKKMVCDSPEELENKLFDDFKRNMTNQEYSRQRAIMSSTNDTIHERNCKFIDKLRGPMQNRYSIDCCMEEKRSIVQY